MGEQKEGMRGKMKNKRNKRKITNIKEGKEENMEEEKAIKQELEKEESKTTTTTTIPPTQTGKKNNKKKEKNTIPYLKQCNTYEKHLQVACIVLTSRLQARNPH